MIVMVTGHRDRLVDPVDLTNFLNWLGHYAGGRPHEVTVLHGGAPGIDTQVGRAAFARGFCEEAMRPDYERLGPKRAPLERNLQMLGRLRVKNGDFVVAGYDWRQEGGTYFTLTHAKKLGLCVVRLDLVPKEGERGTYLQRLREQADAAVVPIPTAALPDRVRKG